MQRLGTSSVLAALMYLSAAALIPASARSTQQPAPPQPPRNASFTAIQQLLSRTPSLAFTEILQDADDEDKVVQLAVSVQDSNLVADAGQCRISYRQRVEKGDTVSDQLLQLDLGQIESIRTAAFESYENEWEAVKGYVYTYTMPQITTVLLVHADHAVNWFAFADAESATRLAEAMTQALRLCRR